MSRFDRNSRYVRYARVYRATDRQGREVQALSPAEIPPGRELGEHLRRDDQRLDHLAAHYLGDPTAFWRIARLNDAMGAELLDERRRLRIPRKE